jgi:hypothetical protein
MPADHPAWVEHQRRRWMRPDAERYWRADAARHIGPEPARELLPESMRQAEPHRRRKNTNALPGIDPVRQYQIDIAIAKATSDIASLRLKLAYGQFARQQAKAFNPEQPRNPAGSPRGGQWVAVGGDYAQLGTRVEFGPGALTGISRIDETTKQLADTLGKIVDAVGLVSDRSPQAYGVAVHMAFGAAVRAQNIPGIGFGDVERSFSLDAVDPRYGLRDTVRTDVVLRNEVGDIVAIYDVKTGGKTLDRARAIELRSKTEAGPNVPVIELSIRRGVNLKSTGVS